MGSQPLYLHKLLFVTIITTWHNSFLYTEVLGRKKAINEYLHKIKLAIDSINESNTLDRILALLIKADASITVSGSDVQQKFEKKDYFASRQKNETQLRFTKTTDNPGRKQKFTSLRCAILHSILHSVLLKQYMEIITICSTCTSLSL